MLLHLAPFEFCLTHKKLAAGDNEYFPKAVDHLKHCVSEIKTIFSRTNFSQISAMIKKLTSVHIAVVIHCPGRLSYQSDFGTIEILLKEFVR